jgi:hypothetical protein
MGYTSEEERWAIVAKWKETSSIRAVCRALKRSKKVVQQWVQRFQATRGVANAVKPGRKPVLNEAAVRQARDLLLGNQNGGCKSVAQVLHASGSSSKLVDRRTISRAVVKLCAKEGVRIRPFSGKPRKQLTAANKAKRLAFCKKNLKRSWKTTMFSDRKKFPFYYPGEKVQAVSWGVEGSKREAPAVNHAQVVNLYAGISIHGITALHIVTGTSSHKTIYKNKQGKTARNITHGEYKHVVESTFLPGGTRMFSTHGVSTWTLQQDNDPTHKAAHGAVAAWNAKRASSVNVLQQWPPNSPDLNPIENLWGYMDAEMNKKGCATFTEYKEELHKLAKTLPLAYLSKLVMSMPNRLAECIRLGGGKTRY